MQLLRARDVLKNKQDHTPDEIAHANDIKAAFSENQEEWEDGIKEKGGDPAKVRVRVLAQYEAARKKRPDERQGDKASKPEDALIDIELLREKDFSEQDWETIQKYKTRIREMEELLRNVEDPKGSQATLRQRIIRDAEDAIRTIVRNKGRTFGVLPDGYFEGRHKGKKVRKKAPPVFRPLKIGPWADRYESLTKADKQFLETIRAYMPGVYPFLDDVANMKSLEEQKQKYEKIQDQLRALVLISKDKWTYDEVMRFDGRKDIYLACLGRTEQALAWVFGSVTEPADAVEKAEYAKEEGWLVELNQKYAIEMPDQRKRIDGAKENFEYWKAEAERVRLIEPGPGGLIDVEDVKEAERQLDLAIERLRTEKGGLTKLKVASLAITDKIIIQRFARALRRSRAAENPFEIHVNLDSDGKAEVLRRFPASKAERAEFERQFGKRKAVVYKHDRARQE
jgi:hypothetical protein